MHEAVRRPSPDRRAEVSMTMSRTAARRPERFLPPIAGGEQKKTGWEALDKWVSGGGGGEGAAPAAEGGPKKTGWEALDKWVAGPTPPPPRRPPPPPPSPPAAQGGPKKAGWEAVGTSV